MRYRMYGGCTPLLAAALIWNIPVQVWAQVSFGTGQTTTLSIDEVLENAPAIIRVEEDWEVVVAQPDPALDVPQICTVFGPTDPSFGTHVVFELNHGTLPHYNQGGMQLQVWWTDSLTGYLGQKSPIELNTPGEVIKYTTVTRLSNYKLRMYIKNGTSTTWGSFGGDGSLYVWLWTSRTHLNPYDPSASLRNSRVTFGANRVSRLCRREIRFYTSSGDLYVKDSTTRYVHQLASDIDTSGPSTTSVTVTADDIDTSPSAESSN